MMLKRIPNDSDLSRAYFELSKMGARCVGDDRRWPYDDMDKYKLLALSAEMSRYDPRLFGILVEYFVNNWQELNPVQLRKTYSLMSTPEIFGVIGEFLKAAGTSSDAAYYVDHLISGLRPVSTQFFFHSTYQIGGYLSKRASESSLAEYKRWGFLASERPTIKAGSKKTIGTLDRHSRLNILKRLLSRKTTIRISDYLKAVDNTISRQQALQDLKKCDFVKMDGRGRGSRWKLAV